MLYADIGGYTPNDWRFDWIGYHQWLIDNTPTSKPTNKPTGQPTSAPSKCEDGFLVHKPTMCPTPCDTSTGRTPTSERTEYLEIVTNTLVDSKGEVVKTETTTEVVEKEKTEDEALPCPTESPTENGLHTPPHWDPYWGQYPTLHPKHTRTYEPTAPRIAQKIFLCPFDHGDGPPFHWWRMPPESRRALTISTEDEEGEERAGGEREINVFANHTLWAQQFAFMGQQLGAMPADLFRGASAEPTVQPTPNEVTKFTETRRFLRGSSGKSPPFNERKVSERKFLRGL